MNAPILTARCKGVSEDYLPLDRCSLRAEIGPCSAGMPRVQEIAITADSAFEGVIRIAIPVEAAAPRFFLPGFMYGTNRGDAPLVVDSKCPRLRPEGDFPASSWWMVRSDRLSHPCAFAFAGGGGGCGGLIAAGGEGHDHG